MTSITKSFVNHVHTSLARQAYNLDDRGAYQAAALSVRDNLIVSSCLQLLPQCCSASSTTYHTFL